MAQNNSPPTPQSGQMKTVSQFLTSPQPLSPINQAYEPYPGAAPVPYPMMPGHAAQVYDRSSAPVMTLKTLFARGYGSTAR